jgi:hypothetical protein
MAAKVGSGAVFETLLPAATIPGATKARSNEAVKSAI